MTGEWSFVGAVDVFAQSVDAPEAPCGKGEYGEEEHHIKARGRRRGGGLTELRNGVSDEERVGGGLAIAIVSCEYFVEACDESNGGAALVEDVVAVEGFGEGGWMGKVDDDDPGVFIFAV